jgi:orotidine-5'-phosphate decarboxylase
MARRLLDLAGMFKIGKQLFTAEGPKAVEAIAKLGTQVFLDLKLHDIPNTVAGAVRVAGSLRGVRLVNVHALGGFEMMRAAARAAKASSTKPKVLAVTLLTSMNAREARRLGIAGPMERRVVALAKLAQRAGLDGVVASPLEIRAIRRACGPRFLIVTPGVRPAASSRGDQARIATPGEAIRAGADYLVVGRPITSARDPRAAAQRILDEMAQALEV